MAANLQIPSTHPVRTFAAMPRGETRQLVRPVEQPHFAMTERDRSTRLVAGGTFAAFGFLAAMFSPAPGLFLMVVGASLVTAVLYSDRRNERERIAVPQHAGETVKSGLVHHLPEAGSRQAQAMEYRDLHREGVISSGEFHQLVGALYPELRR